MSDEIVGKSFPILFGMNNDYPESFGVVVVDSIYHKNYNYEFPDSMGTLPVHYVRGEVFRNVQTGRKQNRQTNVFICDPQYHDEISLRMVKCSTKDIHQSVQECLTYNESHLMTWCDKSLSLINYAENLPHLDFGDETYQKLEWLGSLVDLARNLDYNMNRIKNHISGWNCYDC